MARQAAQDHAVWRRSGTEAFFDILGRVAGRFYAAGSEDRKWPGMHVYLDVDVLALETDDQLSVLVDLTVPAGPAGWECTAAEHAAGGTGLQRLDAGGRLDGAKTALITLIDRLDPADTFGLVAFDQSVEVVVPAGPLTSKAAAKWAVAAVDARGTTDLSGGR